MAPDGLRKGGLALWTALDLGDQPESSSDFLALEACRCVDRLDRLTADLDDADMWLDLSQRFEGANLTVVVDNALSEARQQQMALRQMLHTLGVASMDASTAKENPVDELARERAARRSAAAQGS